MNFRLQLFLSFLMFFQIILIIRRIKFKKLSMRFGILWLIITLILEFGIISPNFIIDMAHFFGFEAASNMVLIIFIFSLFYISLLLTLKMSKQNDQIKHLIQEISILKQRVKKNEK